MTYRIPSANIARLRFDLDRLNKRATKLGLAPIAITSETIETTTEQDDLGFEREKRTHVIEITGTTPVLAGWTFLAALKHVEGQVLIKVAAGATLPTEYLSASPERCDHCHLNRARLASFVVRHEDGRTMVVGRNCLADFIRTTSPETLAAQAEFLTSLDFGGYEVEDEDDRPRGARGHVRINAEDYMIAVLRQIARDGRYISKKEAWRDEALRTKTLATFEAALDVGITDATPAERDAAASTIEWAQAWGEGADPSTEDYRYNVGVVASMVFIEDRVFPIFASIPTAKARAETKAEAKAAEAAKPSEWIGTIGKRQVFTLTVTKPTKVIEGRDGGWGDTFLYFFADKDGNDVRYFASRALYLSTEDGQDIDAHGGPTRVPRVGDVIEIKATVKKQETWNDRKQTTITRGAVVRLVSPGAAVA